MQKNTKILLGLGLIGLAYYLWQKSNKQESNVPEEQPEPQPQESETKKKKNRVIPIGQQNKCELQYLKALASAKQAASMGAMAGILPKELFMKRCEEAKNKES